MMYLVLVCSYKFTFLFIMSVRRWNACNAANSLYLRDFQIFACIIGAGAISRVPNCAYYRDYTRSLHLHTFSQHHVYDLRRKEIKDKVIIIVATPRTCSTLALSGL